jgi:hypothetical protein
MTRDHSATHRHQIRHSSSSSHHHACSVLTDVLAVIAVFAWFGVDTVFDGDAEDVQMNASCTAGFLLN